MLWPWEDAINSEKYISIYITFPSLLGIFLLCSTGGKMELYTFSLSPFSYFVVCVLFVFDVVPELYGLSICERFSSLLFFYFLPESWGAPGMRRWWWSYVINVCRRIYFIGSGYIFICGNKNLSFSIKKMFYASLILSKAFNNLFIDPEIF